MPGDDQLGLWTAVGHPRSSRMSRSGARKERKVVRGVVDPGLSHGEEVVGMYEADGVLTAA